jgi:uncharacterized protein (TIGR03435 family)
MPKKPQPKTNLFLAAILTLSFACAGFCQQPSFEAASIKPSVPGEKGASMHNDPGRIAFSNVSLRNCIVNAYKVRDYQVVGPDWLNSARFDIVATLPSGAPQDQMPLMLQSLLAERFKLSLHRETKELPVYALVVGKNGPKLHETESGDSSMRSSGGHIEAQKSRMPGLAASLSIWAGRPVLDMTGLTGYYDYKLDFSVDPGLMQGVFAEKAAAIAARAGATDGPSIFTAVQEQLGLKLEPRKAPVEILVIDHAEKVPTEN